MKNASIPDRPRWRHANHETAAVYSRTRLFCWARPRAFPLEVQGEQVRISSRPHDGPRALVYFGGNAEVIASTVPELAELFHDWAIYGMHYRGDSGCSGRPAETALRSDARSLFKLVHSRHPAVIVVGRSLGSCLAGQLADTQRLLAAFPPDVATLRIFDGTDHNSMFSEAEFGEALVNGK